MISRIVIAFMGFGILAQGCSMRAAENDWPGWRGPERNGWVSDFHPPDPWPKQLDRVWNVKVGSGYGSPLVIDERVYQHARQGEEEVVWCLDLETGDVQWRKSYLTPFNMGGGAESHGKGPKSSPFYANARLFTLSITGVLSAWDAAMGELLWRQDYQSRFDKNYPYWGASTSPIVDDERVIVHLGNEEHGSLFAFDAATGKELWSQGQDGPCYSSPFSVDIDGVRQIVEWNHRALVGVESKSGRVLWEFPFPHTGQNQNMPTPVYHNGRIMVGGENRGIRSVEPRTSQSDGAGAWTVQERWHQRNVALDMSTAVMNADLLYGFSHYNSGEFFCLDPESGKILWQGPSRTGENVMFLSIPGYVLALINDGELRVLTARGDHYERAASYRVARTSTWAPPVLWRGGLLVKDLDTLTLWSLTRSSPPTP